jgi:hypothetical protein
MMETILSNDKLTITKDRQFYELEFKYPAYEIINSLLKTRIIRDGITDDTYKTIKFKATSVKTLGQYQDYHKKKHGTINFMVNEVAHMIRTLATQLDYLLTYENNTIIGYSPKDIIIIDEEKFAFLGSELVANIEPDGNEMAMISYPFPRDFFLSPEMLIIKEIPSYVHFKTAYFSLACLIIYVLEGNDEFYKNYLNEHYNPEKIVEPLNKHPIKNTKIYWLICRCLKDEPSERSLIYI